MAIGLKKFLDNQKNDIDSRNDIISFFKNLIASKKDEGINDKFNHERDRHIYEEIADIEDVDIYITVSANPNIAFIKISHKKGSAGRATFEFQKQGL